MSDKPVLKRRLPRGLPKCNGSRPIGARSGVKFCRCRRCVLIRALALRRAGHDSEHPGAIVTRMLAENA